MSSSILNARRKADLSEKRKSLEQSVGLAEWAGQIAITGVGNYKCHWPAWRFLHCDGGRFGDMVLIEEVSMRGVNSD